jgi:hypothetical protein
MMPLPHIEVEQVLPAGKVLAVLRSVSSICAAVSPGRKEKINAPTPDTTGAAKLVPWPRE